MERNQKWKILHRFLERRTLSFSSYKNSKLKVRLWWVRTCKRKKEGIFYMFYLSLWWIDYTFRIYMLLHIKRYYFIHFCCLFLKSSEAITVFLRALIHVDTKMHQVISLLLEHEDIQLSRAFYKWNIHLELYISYQKVLIQLKRWVIQSTKWQFAISKVNSSKKCFNFTRKFVFC